MEVDRALQKRDSCTFSGSDGYSSASASKKDCSTIVLSALSVPAGVTLDMTDLEDDTEVIFEGETTFAYEEWDGPLFAVSGSSITVTGASGSSLNGNGADYWDGEGSDGGKTKPKFFQAHDLTDSTISGVTITNAPVQVFSIDTVTTLAVTDVTIDNSAGDSLGANTDCFDIGSSTGVTITNAKCYNQDDCVAINSGSNIIFTGGYCSGGHGLSIGSVGGRDDNTVEDVTFESSQVIDSQQAVRIKTISGDTGTVSSITYKDITISGATDYGIVITQAYDGDEATTGVPITGLTLDGVTGTVSSDADAAIYIDCGSGSCSDWTW
ncbi:family 28 glycoside hydrolase [Cryphonectria parasitica EP155]|uniref:endo-polygalacturonase n=1 Tax=Cryphonectria parasitica (strain ATCC 38755 / EP155) TaxID=660469 RepID=A0A9P4Y305_CRYP1|nr:family 28 glycoside hydrolase [Cryphonectria parasitica EP155]KAF3765554.1 family 28 glycoside hydrolase [Cryphonectria parasitica EP155]